MAWLGTNIYGYLQCCMPRDNVLDNAVLSSVADPDPPDPHFLGLPEPVPDPLVRGMDPDPGTALDPDPSIIMQK